MRHTAAYLMCLADDGMGATIFLSLFGSSVAKLWSVYLGENCLSTGADADVSFYGAITSTVVIALYIFSGISFPVDVLPKSLQLISYSLPLTRGIQAIRLAMDRANWLTISPLFMGELFMGLIYAGIGYLVFTSFEKLSLVDDQIETV